MDGLTCDRMRLLLGFCFRVYFNLEGIVLTLVGGEIWRFIWCNALECVGFDDLVRCDALFRAYGFVRAFRVLTDVGGKKLYA